jgi:hypothetical protein
VQGDNVFNEANLIVANGFTNLGTIELTSSPDSRAAALNVTSGKLVNDKSASIKSLAGNGGSRALGAELDNQGTLTIDGLLTLGRAAAKHTNTGTITANANFTIGQSGAGASFGTSGTITIAAGKTLAVSGVAFDFTAGTLGGPGTLSFSSATASFTPDFSNAVTGLSLNNSTLNGPGKLTNASSLTLVNSTIAANLVNQGTLLAPGGTSRLNGTVTTSADREAKQ